MKKVKPSQMKIKRGQWKLESERKSKKGESGHNWAIFGHAQIQIEKEICSLLKVVVSSSGKKKPVNIYWDRTKLSRDYISLETPNFPPSRPLDPP